MFHKTSLLKYVHSLKEGNEVGGNLLRPYFSLLVLLIIMWHGVSFFRV